MTSEHQSNFEGQVPGEANPGQNWDLDSLAQLYPGVRFAGGTITEGGYPPYDPRFSQNHPEYSGTPTIDHGRRRAVKELAAAAVTVGVGYFGGDSEIVGGVVSRTTDRLGDALQGPIEEQVELTEAEIEALRAIEEQLGQDMPNFEEMLAKAERGEELEEHGPDIIDWIGTGVFADGVRRLSKEKPITQWHLFTQSALVHMKRRKAREEGNLEELHHIDQELAATVRFTTIIEGTVVVAEGMRMDIQRVFESVNDNAELSIQDRIAITTELASMLAPLTTTVGASGMSKEECAKIIKETRALAENMVDSTVTYMTRGMNTGGLSPEEIQESVSAIKGLLQSHISDKAGFPFFGDPPFLASIERFGFVKGMAWQSFIVGAVPAVGSLLNTNTAINKELMKLGIISEENGAAAKQAREALRRNFGFVAGIMGRSAKNIGKLTNQDPDGLEHHILESFASKAKGMKDLLFEETLDPHEHHAEGSRIVDSRYEGYVDSVIASLRDNNIEFNLDDKLALQEDLEEFLLADDFVGLTAYLESKGLDATIARTLILSGQAIDEGIKESEGFNGGKWNPLDVYKRVTDLSRMQAALGHSFTDVINVFPFQSISMIFASPVFKHVFEKYDALTDKVPSSLIAKLVNDAGKFGGIAAFSSVADNLVGVREGFKLTDNPSIALIAGIMGGMLLPPGNMANVVAFPLDNQDHDRRYTTKEAKAQLFRLHTKTLLAGFAWAEILGILNKQVGGLLGFPQPKDAGEDKGHGAETHGHSDEHGAPQTMDRREAIRKFFGM